jgi:endonuclease/exonuclease/phosphatase (EEP) superfamily protein YafD
MPTRKRVVDVLLMLGALGCALVLVASVTPLWPLSLLEHFRLQHVAIGLVITIACAIRSRRWWQLDVAAIATYCHLLWIVPDLSAARRPLPTGTDLRVFVLNVHKTNTNYDEVRSLIAEVHPDVVALIEVDDRWLDALAPTLVPYPSRIVYPRRSGFGLALFARGVLVGKMERMTWLPNIIATLHHHGREIEIVLSHTIPAVEYWLDGFLDRQFARIATRVQSLGDPVVLVGDLNTTPWSSAFRNFLARTGLCDTRPGFGLQATFPTWMPVMQIPIDHVLASCEIGVRDRRVERDVGSDHLPVVVDLVVP